MTRPLGFGYTGNEKLSSNYSLKELTVTDHNIPNVPSSSDFKNLEYLADVLQQIAQISDFRIISAFRSPALQAQLTAEGLPTGGEGGKNSFHTYGRAADITPVEMGLTEFFGAILADQAIMSKLAELALKVDQNAVHLSVNVPGDTRPTKVLELSSSGEYLPMTENTRVSLSLPYFEVQTFDATRTIYVVAALAVLGLGFYFYTREA